jgi:hypothetical protein
LQWSLEFNGVDGYLLLPEVTDIRSVSLWVKLPTVQPQALSYLLDTRKLGLIDGYFSDRCVYDVTGREIVTTD